MVIDNIIVAPCTNARVSFPTLTHVYASSNGGVFTEIPGSPRGYKEQGKGLEFTHAVQTNETWRYAVRFENVDGLGEMSDSTPVVSTTRQPPSKGSLLALRN